VHHKGFTVLYKINFKAQLKPLFSSL